MAGAMRKMAVYLGLAEEDDEGYEEFAEDYDAAEQRDVRPAWDAAPARRTDERRTEEAPLRVARRADTLAARDPGPTVTAASVGTDITRITTLHPRNFNEVVAVGEQFRSGVPVIMNLTDMDDTDARRLIDYAAGLVHGRWGRLERVTAKVFLLTPADVEITAEDKSRIAGGGLFNQS